MLQETGKETLSIKNQHLVLDKVDNLVEFVNSYDHNHNTVGKKMSITGKSKPTNKPSISIIKRSFGEKNAMYRITDSNWVDNTPYMVLFLI